MPPPPPGMPVSLGMAPPPPPGMPPGQGIANPSTKMPTEILTQKSQKWVQMQNKRYGEKRKAGYIDSGKQASFVLFLAFV